MKSRSSFMLLMALILTLLPYAVLAAPDTHSDRCAHHVKVDRWQNEHQLRAHGFYQQNNATGHIMFNRDHLSLDLETTSTPVYASARISDINTDRPVAERVKCWEPTEGRDVVMEATLRFDTAVVPPGLTENQLLWNAPFSRTDSSQNVPITSFGVTRNSAFGGPNYHAVMTMDFNPFNPSTASLFVFKPISLAAPWLVATQWHTIRVIVGDEEATIEVEQNGNRAVVLNAALPHAPGPLGSVFSVDNEVAPGILFPVVKRDGLDLDELELSFEKDHD